jgi:hypothetical protein
MTARLRIEWTYFSILLSGLGVPRFSVFIDVEGIPYGEAFPKLSYGLLRNRNYLFVLSRNRIYIVSITFGEFRKLIKHNQQRHIVLVLWNDNGIHT